jgi:hypothetical protein
MTRARRLLTWVGAVALVLLGGAYGIYWKIVHDRAVAILDEQIEGWRGAGYELAWSSRSTGGFPFEVRAVFSEPAAASPRSADPWSWSAERLTMRLRPWALNEITLEPEGLHKLASAQGELSGEAQGLQVTFATDRVGLTRVSLLSGPAALVERASGTTLAAAEALALVIERDSALPDAFRLVASAERPRWAGAEETAPERASLDAQATSLTPIAARGALDGPALQAWQAAGGAITINGARLDWPDTQVGVSGALDLDRQGLWNGQLVIESSAPLHAFARLAAIGAIGGLDPSEAEQARTLAASVKTEGDRPAPLLFTLREGGVYLFGLRKVGEVPPAY